MSSIRVAAEASTGCEQGSWPLVVVDGGSDGWPSHRDFNGCRCWSRSMVVLRGGKVRRDSISWVQQMNNLWGTSWRDVHRVCGICADFWLHQ